MPNTQQVGIDQRVWCYFVLTTANTLLDLVAQPAWGFLLSVMLFWRLGVIAYYCNMATTDRPLSLRSIYVRLGFALPMLVSAGISLVELPFVFESSMWTSQADLVMAGWLVLGENHVSVGAASAVCDTVHEMFSSFYVASGFWKINTYFLNPKASCATLFMAQHVTQYLSFLGDERTKALVEFLQPFAPVATIVVELGMGLGLLAARYTKNNASSTFYGLALVLGFHFAVCATPLPNDISIFAVECASRLVVVIDPSKLDTTWYKWTTGRRSIGCASAILLLVLAYGVQHNFTPNNWAFVMYIPMTIFLLMAAAAAEPSEDEVPEKPTLRRPLWMYLATGFAIFYSFGAITLGLMDEAMPNMFANLKIHGGSNHLFVPTGLLFAAYQDAPDYYTYGGGVVRVESTTSAWLRDIYPSDLTLTVQPPQVPGMLESLGNPRPNYFHSGKNRILKLFERGVYPSPYDTFTIPYTVPAIELKRLLQEAMERDKSFEVVVAQLDGVRGDEMWRATSWKKRWHLQVEKGHIVQCGVTYPKKGRRKAVPCPLEDLPYHLDVPWWAAKIGSFHGYPILYKMDGEVRGAIPCIGY